MKTFWITADKDGEISIWKNKPFRSKMNVWWAENQASNIYENISEEACKMIIDKVPTWEDEPIKIEIKL